MESILCMLVGLANTHVKETIWGIESDIVDIHNEISGVNDNITSISEILIGLENPHVKDAIRDLGFQIRDLEMK
jgi:hypothetical protein